MKQNAYVFRRWTGVIWNRTLYQQFSSIDHSYWSVQLYHLSSTWRTSGTSTRHQRELDGSTAVTSIWQRSIHVWCFTNQAPDSSNIDNEHWYSGNSTNLHIAKYPVRILFVCEGCTKFCWFLEFSLSTWQDSKVTSNSAGMFLSI